MAFWNKKQEEPEPEPKPNTEFKEKVADILYIDSKRHKDKGYFVPMCAKCPMGGMYIERDQDGHIVKDDEGNAVKKYGLSIDVKTINGRVLYKNADNQWRGFKRGDDYVKTMIKRLSPKDGEKIPDGCTAPAMIFLEAVEDLRRMTDENEDFGNSDLEIELTWSRNAIEPMGTYKHVSLEDGVEDLEYSTHCGMEYTVREKGSGKILLRKNYTGLERTLEEVEFVAEDEEVIEDDGITYKLHEEEGNWNEMENPVKAHKTVTKKKEAKNRKISDMSWKARRSRGHYPD